MGIKKIMPPDGFWQALLMKFFSLLMSVKMHMLTVTTVFLVIGYITETVWRDVIIAIACGNVAISLIEVYKDSKHDPKDPSNYD